MKESLKINKNENFLKILLSIILSRETANSTAISITLLTILAIPIKNTWIQLIMITGTLILIVIVIMINKEANESRTKK